MLEELDKFAQEIKPLVKPGDIPQYILWWKSGVSDNLIKLDSEKYYFIQSGQKFGFSEAMVNELMKFAYERGIDAGKIKNIDYKEEYEKLLAKTLKFCDSIQDEYKD